MSEPGPSRRVPLWKRISSPPPIRADYTASQPPSGNTDKRRKRKRPDRNSPPREMLFTPWMDLCGEQYAKCDTVMDRLHYEILAYEQYMAPTPEEAEARTRTHTLITNALRDLPCVGELRLFGSSAIDLVTPTSDLDMVNSNPRLAHAGPAAAIDALWAIGRRLRQRGIVQDFNVNKWARVPIITFSTRPEFGPFDVDIGINNTDGLDGVLVMRHFLDTMPALRPLLLVLKRFLSQRDLGSAAKSGLGGYGLMCLLVAFLKNNPGGRPQSYFDTPHEELSLGVILMDFFSFYGTTFNYEELYISPEEGVFRPKADALDWIGEKAQYRLVIKCPVTPGHDVARSAGRTAQIVEAFKGGLSLLEHASPPNETVLGPLIGVPQKVVDRRRCLKTLMDSGGYGRNDAAPHYDDGPRPRQNERPPASRRRYSPPRDRRDYRPNEHIPSQQSRRPYQHLRRGRRDG
ncbi:hypothetical protein BD626DRAFT_477789 [Schizophyllum amplum]|uniref:polynucleotide adenylyltransferase n=1 Tax=Schizophyllum amplum TaxID=97359 RepID=A0A550D0H6_9AGAR|nr:hypothetical protein BD626DRAFT_477789 [Auriculariopsis ampla]